MWLQSGFCLQSTYTISSKIHRRNVRMNTEEQKKTSIFRLRLSDLEKSKLKADSESLDMSASELVRRRVFGKKLPTQTHYHAVRKLSTLSTKIKKLPVIENMKEEFLADIAEAILMLGDKNAGKGE